MDWDSLLKVWREHHGKISGVGLGLLFGLAVAVLGLGRTLIISFCIAVGYFIGRRIDDRQGLEDIWYRLFGRRW
ncbi:MAG: DUF2273 domain-containing protein [Moorellaceae bacterium]